MSHQIKERPILFSAPMVRAILDGSKSQTRRVVKPQCTLSDKTGFNWKGFAYGSGFTFSETVRNFAAPQCPYGKPGDQLWVRETWQCLLEVHNCKVGYAATPDNWKNIDLEMLTHEQDEQAWHWAKKVGYAPSIHMPRWASRITLEILSVRVERLKDITEQDSLAEGVAQEQVTSTVKRTAYSEFKNLWCSINGGDSWDANPWVWVIEFKRIG